MGVSRLATSWGQQKPPLGTQLNWAHPLAQGLGIALEMSEGAGLKAVDSTGGHSARITNTAWNGCGILLNGSSSYGIVLNTPELNPSSAMTIETYIKPSTTSDQQIFIKWGSSIAFCQFHFWITAGRWFCHTQQSNGTTVAFDSGVSVVANVWQHVVYTAGPANLTFYIGGKKTATAAWSGSMNLPSPPEDIGIGTKVYGGAPAQPAYFSGSISRIRFYPNRALSAAEIASLYQSPYQMFAAPSNKFFSIPSGAVGLYLPPPGLVNGGFLGQSFGVN